MKRRYYLVLFVILFGAALWGLFHALESSLNLPTADSIKPSPNTLAPEVPAAAVPDTAAQSDVIVYSPATGQRLISPVTVSGEAKGTWFFEGSFPMALINDQGAVIASGAAKAQGNWMTSDYVPFTGTLTFLNFGSAPDAHPNTGYLVLKKDNPSGDSQFDKSVTIKVQW